MQLTKEFPRSKFPVSVIRALYEKWSVVNNIQTLMTARLSVTRDLETWSFDDFEEFFDEYVKGFNSAYISTLGDSGPSDPLAPRGESSSLDFQQFDDVARISVTGKNRNKVVGVVNFLSEVSDRYVVAPPVVAPERPRIFIGHGRGRDWESLYRHLRDQHKLDIFAYETEERAGQNIQEFLSEALAHANYAIMVMTGDDLMNSGGQRARQNVVHETGLFQGKLGWSRVVLVAEEGIEGYSNLAGVQELRFAPGGIDAIAGRLLAVLRREFGNSI